MSKKATAVQKKSYTNENNYSHEAKQNLERARRILSNSKQKPSEKEIQEAFRQLSEACNKDGQIAEAFSLRGQCYNQMGDFQRALYDFTVAIRIEKDNYTPGAMSNARLAEYCNHAGV